jgi:Oxidoreductase family, NAD-binding Rossmann fold
LSTNNILLIGAGQIGSRHLQGLARSEEPLLITIVERMDSNLELAINRFKEISGHEKHVLSSFNSLQKVTRQPFDIAIIATNADVRYEITKQLVTSFEVKNIIFEKVAFQSENQFLEIIQLLHSNKIKSWVNCPRRYFPFYQRLKDYLKNKGLLQLSVEGIDWGLACNAVHHIDLLAFLTGDSIYKIDQNQLDPKIYQSKRPQFIEFYGSFSGKSAAGNSFTLSCKTKNQEDDKPAFIHRFETSAETIIINELQGVAEFYDKLDEKIQRTEEVKMIFQSGLTHIQVSEIMHSGLSKLPTIEESFEVHRPLLKMLKDQYQQIEGRYIDELPIT